MINFENLDLISVTQLENKNQFVRTYKGKEEQQKILVFQSYNSIIAVYDNKNELLDIYSDYDYSKTTLKHLKLFINSYTCYTYETTHQFAGLIYNKNKISFIEKSYIND